MPRVKEVPQKVQPIEEEEDEILSQGYNNILQDASTAAATSELESFSVSGDNFEPPVTPGHGFSDSEQSQEGEEEDPIVEFEEDSVQQTEQTHVSDNSDVEIVKESNNNNPDEVFCCVVCQNDVDNKTKNCIVCGEPVHDECQYYNSEDYIQQELKAMWEKGVVFCSENCFCGATEDDISDFIYCLFHFFFLILHTSSCFKWL